MTPSTTTAAHQATGSKERRHLHPASSDTGAKLDARGGGVALDIFGWCCVVLSAHVLVDAFVDLRPGTSPTDHLISGTIPVAVLATLAFAYRRLGTGIGATIAVLLGLAAAGVGAANVAAVVLDGFTVGRLTGLATGGAGVVLVALGTATLFRARRPGGSRLRRWTRRVAKTLVVLALIMLTSVPIVFGYISANWSVGYALDEVALGASYERMTIETADGLSLAAAYRPSENGAAVIVFPGRLPRQADMMAAHGYGVLLVEPRGRSGSDGDPNLIGWTGEEDLRAAVRYLQARPDVVEGRIGGLGLSVGGELMLQAAARLPALRAVVSEGAGSRSVGEEVVEPIPRSELLPAAFGLANSFMTDVAVAVFSDSLPPAPIQDLVDDIAPRPIMLIWTRRGQGGEHLNPHYHARALEPKIIWEVPEGGHVGAIDARPHEYERRVISFFDQALLD